MEQLDETSLYPTIPRYRVKAILDKYRDTLSDDEFDLLTGLYECRGRFEDLSKETGREVRDLYQEYQTFLAKSKRIRSDGRTWRTSLSTKSLKIILEKYDFTEEERRLLEARVRSRNQMIAATALGLSYHEYASAFLKVRDQHGF